MATAWNVHLRITLASYGFLEAQLIVAAMWCGNRFQERRKVQNKPLDAMPYYLPLFFESVLTKALKIVSKKVSECVSSLT